MKKIFFILFIFTLTFQIPFAQELPKDISKMTKEDVLNLTYDQLLELPFEDLLKLADIVGVSLDELYEMILNKDIVSASKKVESSFESPLSTSVISHDEIVESGARTIEEVLRLVPGLIVREKTNGNFDVHIRGNDNLPPDHMFVYSENSITLVMIDNRPVYNYVHGGTFWETLPVGIEDIDRIEVVRGPSSALYGPNAVSGVVNIITKVQESKKLSVDANAQAGTQNTIISSVGVGKAFNDRLSFRLTGNFQTMDRNSDLLYVHAANNGEGGFISKETLDTLRKWSPLENSWFYVYDPTDNINDMYPDPLLSRRRMGGNAYLFFNPGENIHIDLKGGYQSSEVLSTTMGDNPTSYAGRASNTGYVDLNAKISGLRAQINYLGGWQDIVRSDTGFKVDIANLNANLEYDFNIGNLNLRPGFAFQLGRYDDSDYLRYIGQGFLNGQKQFTSLALSLRADYLAFEKLRIIGALRGEKYNTHNRPYLSYQFIGSYLLNSSNFLRIVYSKANRGPFLVDSYANYEWEREGRPLPGYIYFGGRENLDLLTMNMLEFGYRVKPVKSVQADFEFFMINAKNFGALYPDSVNLNGAVYNDGFFDETNGRPWVTMSYQNIDITSKQFGVTGSVSWVARENIILRLFATWQRTYLYNVIPISPDEAVNYMITDAILQSQLTNSTVTFSKRFPDERVDKEENSSTPSVFGGFTVSIKMLDEKLTLHTDAYAYSSQTFANKNGTVEIDGKVILNVRLSCKLYRDNLSLFVNARNLLGKQREFAFMDEIGPIYLIGLNANF